MQTIPESTNSAMTIDVEDYYQVSAMAKAVNYKDWDSWPSRVVNNTTKILDIFDEFNTKATFFVLGWVAERHPEIVREIDRRGHEIASHGYSHQLIYNQEPKIFHDETRRSKQILEDIIGRGIEGYRAASYSVTRSSLWALETLIELGFKWDSSIFPVHHDRYGIAGSPELPYTLVNENQQKLIEFPLTTAKVFGMSVPAAGGGYFRQYPYMLSKYLFSKASENSSKPMIFYLHPWEIDAEQPRIKNAGFISNFRHYTNLSRCEKRLKNILDDFRFCTVSEVLNQNDCSKEVTIDSLK